MKTDKALCDAYLQTIYRVLDRPPLVDIRIGEHSAALDRLLEDYGVREWAFVTASNPRSRRLPDRVNARRNAEMKHSLQQAGWRALEAIGLPPDDRWQAEASVLIPGMDRDAAMKIALRWEQNAFVHGVIGQPAELVWVI
jgi:Protein of unknown function (DUF3293)